MLMSLTSLPLNRLITELLIGMHSYLLLSNIPVLYSGFGSGFR